ncbi:MAG TPA: hypothetical protein VD766_09420 [Solirubrobacterales bacterium]|nr:hypothetical protein [Solirubrobacterales bacterium]
MAGFSALVSSRARAVSWTALYKSAMWLYGRGQQFWDNLSASERSELGAILRKSKGRRANLESREIDRLKGLVQKGFRGERPD